VPAAGPEYARDAAFGYTSSNLRAWVSEKHGGEIAPGDVATITLSNLRLGGPEAIARQLDGVRGGQVCIVNAATYRDLEVFVAGLLAAEAAGQHFLYRTAASFVRVRAGLPPRALLAAADLPLHGTGRGGLVVVGSYIQKSTQQAEAAAALPGVRSVELRVDRLLAPAGRASEVQRVAAHVDRAISDGQDALVYTSRQLVTDADREKSLQIGQAVSSALVDVVRALSTRPAWVIAKGGITSSDVATRGLGVTRALVLGQALPGVPIWYTGGESRWPDLVYVVFPGNVGGPDALARMIQILRQG
ncbi:MAG TPA: nucleotide-binding domain containing protein, partial [Anaerolineae bacterium]|nr:nucleotide-binding domain containing protein [Anaerolineae bacterium]